MDWVKDFLQKRVAVDRKGITIPSLTMNAAFEECSAIHDIHGGIMVNVPLRESWKLNWPRGETAYHGTDIYRSYSIACRGLLEGPSLKADRNGRLVRGVFVHKHGTRKKARNYMKHVLFPGGFAVGVLLTCRVEDPPKRRTCPPDQWCLPQDGVQVESVGFHFLRFEDVDLRPGEFWIAGMWDPCNEVSPLAEGASDPFV